MQRYMVTRFMNAQYISLVNKCSKTFISCFILETYSLKTLDIIVVDISHILVQPKIAGFHVQTANACL